MTPGLRSLADRLWARAEAFEESAYHLELHWTDDALEFREGNRLSKLWHRQARILRKRAGEIRATSEFR